MKRILISLLVSILFFGGADDMCAHVPDSLQLKALSVKLDEYCIALEHESLDVQKEECDFLIESSSDSLVRQFVALTLYDRYRNSKVMGAEAVAVHLIDKWFLPGAVRMRNDIELTEASVFAEFNRLSQVGMKAPPLELYSMDGEKRMLFGGDCGESRFSILYFYDADCPKCRIETIKLRNMLSLNEFPVNLYAVYVGDDRDRWASSAAALSEIDNPDVALFHLWDPEIASDFQRKYGVVSTPSVFLVGRDCVIRGRRLDTEALEQMLSDIFGIRELDYGSDGSVALFDAVLGSGASEAEILALADDIASRTLMRSDTLMFRQLAGDMLYYLAPKTGEGCRNGTEKFIDRYILSRNDIWKSPDDSMKVIGFASIMADLLSKASVGEMVTDLKLPCEQVHAGKIRQGECRLGRLKGARNILLFYTEGCDACAEEKKAAVKLSVRDRRLRVYMINVDDIISSDPELAESMFDAFDLSVLPYLVQTDGKGVVKRRYFTLAW